VLVRSNKGLPLTPQAARRDAPIQCPVCGRAAQRKSRNQRFCSARCRKRDYEKNGRTRVIFAGLGLDTRDHDAPSQKPNGFNGLQAAKSGSTPRIHGPRDVIATELFNGRDWIPVVSPDGVIAHVARLGSAP
jgi:endogenous inhibitor of DNA gyrase (YacG/DUF329 family)